MRTISHRTCLSKGLNSLQYIIKAFKNAIKTIKRIYAAYVLFVMLEHKVFGVNILVTSVQVTSAIYLLYVAFVRNY